MKAWVLAIGGLALLILAGAGYGVYLETGLKEYAQVERAINHLHGEQREAIRQEFWAADGEVFSGILGKISVNGRRLWLWAGGWPRRYEVGEAAIFTFYDICQAAKNMEDDEQGQGKFTVDDSVRMATQDIKEWEKYVAKGSYAQVRIDISGGGKKLVEAHAYRWPLFLPFRLEELCAE